MRSKRRENRLKTKAWRLAGAAKPPLFYEFSGGFNSTNEYSADITLELRLRVAGSLIEIASRPDSMPMTSHIPGKCFASTANQRVA